MNPRLLIALFLFVGLLSVTQADTASAAPVAAPVKFTLPEPVSTATAAPADKPALSQAPAAPKVPLIFGVDAREFGNLIVLVQAAGNSNAEVREITAQIQALERKRLILSTRLAVEANPGKADKLRTLLTNMEKEPARDAVK